MTVYTDNDGRIMAVGHTDDDELIPVEIIDDEENPFNGWSDARICCYRVQVSDGHVIMMTPFVSSILIDFVDRFGTATSINTSDISDNREGIIETYEQTTQAASDISDLREATIELYEMIGGGE